MAKQTKKEKYKFKFSFIMPVYNVENYIDEAVVSVLSQTLVFKENVQLIFVDDGSQDRSGEICQSYKKQFPDNIVYVKQKNKGVSGARNGGLDHVEGKYICFLDSDDKLSHNALGEVYKFFEENYSEIDIVSIRMNFFGRINGEHYRNDVYNRGDRIVNLNVEYKDPLTYGPRLFFKTEALIGKHYFDETLKYVEDVLLIQNMLADKMAYGVVEKPIYYHRERHGLAQETSKQIHDKSWYTIVPHKFYEGLIKYNQNESGKLPAYIQHTMLNDIIWRYKMTSAPALMAEELKEYKEYLDKNLQLIDDAVILEYKGPVPLEYKVYLLARKHNVDILESAKYRDDGGLYLNELLIFSAPSTPLVVEFLDIRDGTIFLEGWYGGFKNKQSRVMLEYGGEQYDLQNSYQPKMDKYSLDDLMYSKTAFKVALPIIDGDVISIKPIIKIKETVFPIYLGFGNFSYLHKKTPSSYRILNNHIFIAAGNHMLIKKRSLAEHLKRETKYLIMLAKSKEYMPIGYRLAHYLINPLLRRRKIWLISDRPHTTGDNADFLFRYICEVREGSSNIRPVFALNRAHPEYESLQKIGEVVPFGSIKYKLLFLSASKRISSHFDWYVINPFGTKRAYLCDLFKFDYVYLEHGILSSDSSSQFGKYSKNISLLTAASEFEREAIVTNKDYGYDNQVVKLTGHPRFDPLVSKGTNKIIFMPTWRFNIVGNNELGPNELPTGRRLYNDSFKDSEYFRFYNSLINDERLLRLLNKLDYTVEFYIHPNHSPQWSDFQTSSERVRLMKPPHNYIKALREGAMMITDYSGVAFDFAYMKKPIIYTQFDKDSLYTDHYYEKGYFSFEGDGFGPVVYGLEEAVKAITDTLDKGCQMPAVYKKRVEKFFAYKDHENSKRVYEAIIAMDSNKV